MLNCKKNERGTGKRAFTLVEVMVSLIVATALVFLGTKLLTLVSQNSREVEETMFIDKGLSLLLYEVKADLESIVLKDKDLPVFEIQERSGERGFKVFFFTTNSEKHITTAVKYDVMELDVGKIEISRTTLSDSATLLLQSLMRADRSFEKFFEDMNPEDKSCRRFNIRLSDFKIRVALKPPSGHATISSPNASVLYSNGHLWENHRRRSALKGSLIFFDVTVRAFTKSDAVKFEAKKVKNLDDAKEFLFSHSRKNFIRITPNSVLP